MFKFNNDHVFTGYLKQLLSSFNLPKYKVYTAEQQKYHNRYLKARSELPTKQAEIAELKARIESLKQQDRPEDLEKAYKKYQYLLTECVELKKIVGQGPELNILATINRNEPKHLYSNAVHGETEIDYPEHMRYIPYIKDNKIQMYAPKIDENGQVIYSKDDWKDCHIEFGLEHKDTHKQHSDIYTPAGYVYNLAVKNYTKNLKITNGVYDSYTHEYLGDYLRFHRDYRQINLMPLYNCFSNRVCPNLKVAIKVSTDITTPYIDTINNIIYLTIGDEKLIAADYPNIAYAVTDPTIASISPEGLVTALKVGSTTIAGTGITIIVGEESERDITGYTAEFDTSDSHYKIYMVPIKLFQKYTIAIDCEDAVEMCCGLYGQYQYDDKYKSLMFDTYTCYNYMQFNKPVLFDKTLYLNKYTAPFDSLELAQHEDDLKLFIKLPADNKSSIVVLEGDYTSYNDSMLYSDDTRKTNHTVINFAGDYEEVSKNLITPLQLLKLNTGVSHPFADRLIEYLTGNAITLTDEIGDNIERAKLAASKTNKLPIIVDGLWDPVLPAIFYNFINSKHNTEKINHDILGYVDKDVEQLYSFRVNKTDDKIETISSANIYGDEWED